MSENESSEVMIEDTFKSPEEIKKERKLKNARRNVIILSIIIALNTAAAIFIGQLYKQPSYDSGRGSVSTAMADYRLNDMSSTTVYNQMVTNGWVARDLLKTIGEQNATLIEQNSESNFMIGWLLFNILFTLGWFSIAMIRLGLMFYEEKHSS